MTVRSKILLGLVAFLFIVSLIIACLPTARAVSPVLPTLAWSPRSDWVNVKSVTPAAVGDGVTDDTAAVQSALNTLQDTPQGKRVVFFPAGTYLIKNTLTLSHILGPALIGTGQGSVIKWGGATGGVMYHSNGTAYARYIGLVWDGSGTAAVGCDHRAAAETYYETRVRHKNELYKNFTEAGIRVGLPPQALPSAEIMYENDLFQNNKSGVEFLTWNDYNNIFYGCDFRDNANGINCQEGNFQARECHFERSSFSDMIICPHSFEILRCTSTGSNQFVFASGGGPATCAALIEDCAVNGWTHADAGAQSATVGSTFGAINFGLRGPLTVLDCTFTNPPANTVNAINLLTNNNSYLSPDNKAGDGGYGTYLLQTAIVSHNTPAGVTPGASSQITQVPWISGTNRGALITDPTHSFFKASEDVSGRVFDAKLSYGAYGDNIHDDTAAIQATIQAAAAYGHGAVAYLPSGVYNVSAPLLVSGGNYTFGGSGYATLLNWLPTSTGPGPIISVVDPQSVKVEQLRFNSSYNVAEVQQSSASGPSSVTYDTLFGTKSFLGVRSGGSINKTLSARGLECVSLSAGSLVNITEFDGNLSFLNCSQATILASFCVDGVLNVAGSAFAKTGYLGILARDASGNPCDIVVRDNQDLTMTSFYTEQTNSVLAVSGDGAYLGQPGHVTIAATQLSPRDTNFINVNNYEGRVSLLGAITDKIQDETLADIRRTAALNQYTFTSTGTRPSTFMTLGTMFTYNPPSFVSSNYTSLGNNVTDGQSASDALFVPYHLAGAGTVPPASLAPGAALSAKSAAALATVGSTLDDLRLLGAMDLAVNYSYPSATLPAH